MILFWPDEKIVDLGWVRVLKLQPLRYEYRTGEYVAIPQDGDAFINGVMIRQSDFRKIFNRLELRVSDIERSALRLPDDYHKQLLQEHASKRLKVESERAEHEFQTVFYAYVLRDS